MSRHRNIRNLDYDDYMDDYDDDYDDYDYDDEEEEEESEDEYGTSYNSNQDYKYMDNSTNNSTKKVESQLKKVSLKEEKKVLTLDQFQEISKKKTVTSSIQTTQNNNNNKNVKAKTISLSISSSLEKIDKVGNSSVEKVDSQKFENTRKQSTNISRSNSKDIEELMKNEKKSDKEKINLIVIGHVDAGKSTLMGHLLTLIGEINERTIQKYEREAQKMGKGSFAYAWVLDETEEERNRGVTMDVAITKFETKKKEVYLLDSPGHKDFITNMITGAFQADAAILVINSKIGDFEAGFDLGGQTREHTLLIRSLGIQQLIVAVNKLDTIEWSQERFNEIKSRLLPFISSTVGFTKSNVTFIPCSGLIGENLVERSNENLTKWYNGKTLIEQIDDLESPSVNSEILKKPLRMAVSDYFSGGLGGSTVTINGRIEAGNIQIGDNILITPPNENAKVKHIMVNYEPKKYAIVGDNVTIGITGPDILQISTKSYLSSINDPIPSGKKFEVKIILFNIDTPITIGYPAIFHHQNITEQMHFSKLIRVFNKSGEIIKEKPKCLTKSHNSAIVQIKLAKPICAETFENNKHLGRFVIRSNGTTVAAGVILKVISRKNKKSKNKKGKN